MSEIDGTPCLTSLAEILPYSGGGIELLELVRFEGVSERKRYWRLMTRSSPLMDLLLERGIELQVGMALLGPIEETGDAGKSGPP